MVRGQISSDKVRYFTNEFKKLPSQKAIFCLTEYKKGLQRIQQSQTLTVESSVPLSKTQVKKITDSFKKELITEVETRLNSSLLGGVRVTIGDSVFDDSIESKIEQIGEAIRA